MDPRSPVPGRFIHEPFDCEALERSKWANQPCKVMPWHLTNAGVCIAILAAIAAVLWRMT